MEMRKGINCLKTIYFDKHLKSLKSEGKIMNYYGIIAIFVAIFG